MICVYLDLYFKKSITKYDIIKLADKYENNHYISIYMPITYY